MLDIGQLRLVDEVALVDDLAGQTRGIRLGAQALESNDPLAVLNEDMCVLWLALIRCKMYNDFSFKQ